MERNNKEDLQAFLLDENLEKLENLTETFNIFSSLKSVYSESTHSNFLAWLLNPIETHGIGDYFLTRFLYHVTIQKSENTNQDISIFDVDQWELEDTRILREYKNMDIAIIDKKNSFVCIIENKIRSSTHSNQLQTYKETINNEYNQYKKIFIYLTMYGEIPTDEDYIVISYEDIIKILDEILINKRDNIKQEIYEFIDDYKETLRRYIVADSEEKEICEAIYRKHENAIKLIYKYIPDDSGKMAKSISEIIDNDKDYLLVNSTSRIIQFIPKELDFIPKEGKGWGKTDRMLLFWFDTSNNLKLELTIGPGNSKIREEIYNIARLDKKLFRRVKNPYKHGKWNQIYKKDNIIEKEAFQGITEEELKIEMDTIKIEITKRSNFIASHKNRFNRMIKS